MARAEGDVRWKWWSCDRAGNAMAPLSSARFRRRNRRSRNRKGRTQLDSDRENDVVISHSDEYEAAD